MANLISWLVLTREHFWKTLYWNDVFPAKMTLVCARSMLLIIYLLYEKISYSLSFSSKDLKLSNVLAFERVRLSVFHWEKLSRGIFAFLLLKSRTSFIRTCRFRFESFIPFAFAYTKAQLSFSFWERVYMYVLRCNSLCFPFCKWFHGHPSNVGWVCWFSTLHREVPLRGSVNIHH